MAAFCEKLSSNFSFQKSLHRKMKCNWWIKIQRWIRAKETLPPPAPPLTPSIDPCCLYLSCSLLIVKGLSAHDQDTGNCSPIHRPSFLLIRYPLSCRVFFFVFADRSGARHSLLLLYPLSVTVVKYMWCTEILFCSPLFLLCSSRSHVSGVGSSWSVSTNRRISDHVFLISAPFSVN